VDLTVVIPFYEGHRTIGPLLASIPSEIPVIIVDDLSDRSVEVKRENTQVLRLTEKGYFSGAVNFGIQKCKTDVLILNQDIEFTSHDAFNFIAHYKDEYALIGESISGNHPAWPMKYVHGTFMYMRRDAIEKVGLLDEQYYPLWGSTCEWQLRICRQGFSAFPSKIPGMTHKRDGNYGSSIKKLLSEESNKRGLFIRTPPLISVIVPAYNHGRFLPDLINSLIGGSTSLGEMLPQTFQAFDVIIADDCSTDNTQEVMQELADPWKGIRYVRTKSNSGTSAACNLAIDASYAKYIARIDADDMREYRSLEAMLNIQLANPHSFVYDDVDLFTARGRAKTWIMEDYDFDNILDKNRIHAGIMFPKEAWKEVGGYPEEMRHGRDDWAFNVALGLKGWCGVHLNQVGYLYRRHDHNRTTWNTTPRHRQDFKRTIQGLYPEAYAEVRPMGCCGGSRPRVMISQTRKPPNGGGGTYAMGAGMPGAEGMVLVEYLGGNVGEQTYYGAVTGSAYTFSKKKNKRWVDPNDLHAETANNRAIGLLDLMDKKNAPLFKQVRQPAKEKIVEATTIAEEMTVEPEEIVEPIPAPKVLEPPEDDFFTPIKGVGVATSRKLIKKGYYSFEQLYETDPDNLLEEFGWSEDRVDSIREQLREIILGQ